MKFTKHKKQVFLDAAKISHLTLQIGESDILRKKSKEVKQSQIKSTEIKKVISDLKKTLLEYKKLTGKGRGIAASQIGKLLKIAVLFTDGNLITIINPKIIKKSPELLIYPEICMSANPIIAKVIRPSWIKTEYLDEEGKKQIWNKKDLILNRVLQHEIDHMEGIINIDLVKPDQLILDSDPGYFKKAKFKKASNGAFSKPHFKSKTNA